MHDSHVPRDSPLSQYARLFAPGQRLGWVFRDRWKSYRPFTEPVPRMEHVPEVLRDRKDNAVNRFRDRVISSVVTSAALFVIFFLLGEVAQWFLDGFAWIFQFEVDFNLDAAGMILGVVAVIVGAIVIGVSLFDRWDATKTVRCVEEEVAERNRQERNAWQARQEAHERDEYVRVDQLDEWGAVRTPPGIRRLDIFGSSLRSWDAFLTVYGTSVLGERPLVVVDLTRELVCRELAAIARASNVPVDTQMLPTQLAETNLLSGLTPRQLVDTLIESMYSGGDSKSNTMRAERSMSDRILTELVQALGDDLSMGRLAAGLGILMGQPDNSGYLTRDECRHIADELFTTKYRDASMTTLLPLEAEVRQLAELSTRRKERGPGYLTCIALDSDARNVRSELLTDLVVQWLTHRIISEQTSTPSVIIAGADELAPRHLKQLSDVCERRHVHLTLMFRQLSKTGLEILGRGAVGFMKLDNHYESEKAANFIGKQHKFELSQLTHTLGGSESRTIKDPEVWFRNTGISVRTPVGWTGNWNKSNFTPCSDNGSIFDENQIDKDGDIGKDLTDSEERRRIRFAGYSYTEAVNWNNSKSFQRVYEYAVEPIQLQSLPDCTMLLVVPEPGCRKDVIPVEFDPAIITLLRVRTDPFPDLPITG